jgi:hypothetical protein
VLRVAKPCGCRSPSNAPAWLPPQALSLALHPALGADLLRIARCAPSLRRLTLAGRPAAAGSAGLAAGSAMAAWGGGQPTAFGVAALPPGGMGDAGGLQYPPELAFQQLPQQQQAPGLASGISLTLPALLVGLQELHLRGAGCFLTSLDVSAVAALSRLDLGHAPALRELGGGLPRGLRRLDGGGLGSLTALDLSGVREVGGSLSGCVSLRRLRGGGCSSSLDISMSEEVR